MKYLIIGVALAFAGCTCENETGGRKYHMKTICTAIYSTEIEGHRYIVYSGCKKGCIIHSESCPCKVKEVGK